MKQLAVAVSLYARDCRVPTVHLGTGQGTRGPSQTLHYKRQARSPKQEYNPLILPWTSASF